MKFKLIQGFRGVAALIVIQYHLILHIQNSLKYTIFNGFFKFGLVGVDFFFVLSGFIITYVHYSDILKKADWRQFYRKRFVRVYPLYWVIALCSVIIYIYFTPNRLKDAGLTMDLTSPAILSSLLQSFLLIPQKGMYLVGVAWTLSYEVLFYLVFGVCIIAGHRFAKAIMGVWLLLILLNALVLQPANFYVDFLLNPVIIEFMMGCVIGYMVIKQIKLPVALLGALLFILLIITLNVVELNGLRIERSLLYVTLLGALFGILTLLAVKINLGNPRLKYPALFLLPGDASYAIYLFHQTFYTALLVVYNKLRIMFSLNVHPLLVAMLVFCVTLIAGVLVHVLIEKPLLKWLRKPAKKDAELLPS